MLGYACTQAEDSILRHITLYLQVQKKKKKKETDQFISKSCWASRTHTYRSLQEVVAPLNPHPVLFPHRHTELLFLKFDSDAELSSTDRDISDKKVTRRKCLSRWTTLKFPTSDKKVPRWPQNYFKRVTGQVHSYCSIKAWLSEWS